MTTSADDAWLRERLRAAAGRGLSSERARREADWLAGDVLRHKRTLARRLIAEALASRLADRTGHWTTRAARRRTVAELRAQGLSLRAVAARLGVSEATVRRDLGAASPGRVSALRDGPGTVSDDAAGCRAPNVIDLPRRETK